MTETPAEPWLSVVMPALDEAAGIAIALAPLQPLRARGCEIIVVDGGSRDDTVALATPLCDKVLSSPRGRSLQMNAGADAARGSVLLFLHADTRLPDSADLLIREALAGGGRSWGRFDVRIAGRSAMLPVVAAMMNLRSRLTGIATGDQAMFVTRTAFEAAGGFPPIALMEDIALSRSLRRLGRPANLGARVVTSGRRWDENGAWRTILLMWRLRAAFFLGANPDTLSAQYRSRPAPVATAQRRKER